MCGKIKLPMREAWLGKTLKRFLRHMLKSCRIKHKKLAEDVLPALYNSRRPGYPLGGLLVSIAQRCFTTALKVTNK